MDTSRAIWYHQATQPSCEARQRRGHTMDRLTAVDPRIVLLAAQRAIVDERIIPLMERRLAAGYSLKLTASYMTEVSAADLKRWEAGENRPDSVDILMLDCALKEIDEQYERAYPMLRENAQSLVGTGESISSVPDGQGGLQPATQGGLYDAGDGSIPRGVID